MHAKFCLLSQCSNYIGQNYSKNIPRLPNVWFCSVCTLMFMLINVNFHVIDFLKYKAKLKNFDFEIDTKQYWLLPEIILMIMKFL